MMLRVRLRDVVTSWGNCEGPEVLRMGGVGNDDGEKRMHLELLCHLLCMKKASDGLIKGTQGRCQGAQGR